MPEEFFQAFVRLRSATTHEWIAPEELRPLLVADADAQDSNLTDVVVAILSKRYGIPYEASGRKTASNPHGEELNLRLPMRLYRSIAASASRHPRNVQREILSALCGHYNLTMPAQARKTRRRRRAAPAA